MEVVQQKVMFLKILAPHGLETAPFSRRTWNHAVPLLFPRPHPSPFPTTDRVRFHLTRPHPLTGHSKQPQGGGRLSLADRSKSTLVFPSANLTDVLGTYSSTLSFVTVASPIFLSHPRCRHNYNAVRNNIRLASYLSPFPRRHC